jgi:hypothetical protein
MAIAVLVVTGLASPLHGQTGFPGDLSEQARVLVLSPTLRLTDLGWDNNIFRVNKTEAPTGDFTTTVTPALEASFRLRRLQISGRGDVDFVYFREMSQLRSIDTDDGVRVGLLLGRVRPYVGADWASARHRRNFEIDLPVRRVDSSWVAGVDFSLSGKTSVGVISRRSREDFKGETAYLDSDLAFYLGATTTIEGARLRYALTPLTTIGINVEQDRSDFAFASERNSEGFRVMSTVDFQPFAAVSGSAQVGVRKRTFTDSHVPPFQGTVARIDLGYTLLGRTRFAVSGQRDLSYSYRPDQRDYLQSGLALTLTQRVANTWDVEGTLGQFSLIYGLTGISGTSPTERVTSYGLGVGRYIEHTRVGFEVARQTRTSDFSGSRDYEGMRIASSVSYRF